MFRFRNIRKTSWVAFVGVCMGLGFVVDIFAIRERVSGVLDAISPFVATVIPYVFTVGFPICVFLSLFFACQDLYRWARDRMSGGPDMRAFSRLAGEMAQCKVMLIGLQGSELFGRDLIDTGRHAEVHERLERLSRSLKKWGGFLYAGVVTDTTIVDRLSRLEVCARAGDIERARDLGGFFRGNESG